MSWILKKRVFSLFSGNQRKTKLSARTLKKSKISIKLALGGILLLFFFLSYQPAFKFPPVKSTSVHAQEMAQTQVIEAAELPITFQIPHPGYLSTPYSTFHPGLDIASGLGMPIKPIAKGTVSEAGFNFWGLGLVVEVDHGLGYKSLYAHMGRTYVKKGQEVSENSFLGEIGMTGNTSGPHTHLEVSRDNHKIDPRVILPKIRDYPEESDFIALNTNQPAIAAPAKTTISTPLSTATPKPTASPTTQEILNQPLSLNNLGNNQSLQVLK